MSKRTLIWSILYFTSIGLIFIFYEYFVNHSSDNSFLVFLVVFLPFLFFYKYGLNRLGVSISNANIILIFEITTGVLIGVLLTVEVNIVAGCIATIGIIAFAYKQNESFRDVIKGDL